MRSPFADWLDKMQHIADEESIVVQARHYDVLDYYFQKKDTPKEAYDSYKKFLIRWNAITQNGRFTEELT